jgi:Na+/melibiose symporter-like transporter
MIQFASGVIPVWGNSNIYYLSYFKNHGENVSQGTNSKILIATVIPMACLVIFSTKLSNKFGFTFVIKICSIIFLLSQFIAYMFFRLPTMVLFLLIIPISSLSISIIPMYNCLWSYFL